MTRTTPLLTLVFLLAVAGNAFADGMLIPGPPNAVIVDEPYFTIKYHRVKSEIRDQVCTTYVDQVFVNETRREMEATYLFPLPAGAVVQQFTLHADGQEIPARLLTKEEAQRIYEDIVRRRRDPALLTYAGNNAYQARIFPIPAGGERRIELRYTELLSYDNGLVTYLYPLSPEGLSPRPLEEVVFTGDIYSRQPIGSVYSPTHDVSVNRLSDYHVKVSYEEKDVLPDRDILLYYNVAQGPVGLSLLTFKEPGQNGFFLLLAAPAVEEHSGEVLPKHLCFVLDTSGSMSGEKIEQVQEALTFCVNSLNRQDKFNIVAFSDHVKDFAGELVPASRERVEEAREFIAGFEARGATDLDTALRTALQHRAPGENNYIVFLTDGQPTAGEQNEEKIIQNFTEQAGELDSTTRLFVFGVGYHVNTHLLDKLAQGNGGLTTYVRPTESIEAKISNFFSKIAQPLLMDLHLDWGSVETFDRLPRELPDLFHGLQIEVFGRYTRGSAGATTITLSGSAPQGSSEFKLECTFPEAKEGTDYIASLWAARKIGYLLDQIRLHGESEELIDEIVKLSLEYGILTEYTAFLAEEGRALATEEVAERAAGAMRAGYAPVAGPAAVSQAQNAQGMQVQAQVGLTNTYLDAEGNRKRISNIQNVGQRGFVLRDGRWEDTRYQPEHEVALQVQAYSEAHFQLSRNFPTLNAQLGMGDNVLVILNGQIIEIGDEGKTHLTEEELDSLRAGTASATTVSQQPTPRGLLAGLLGLLGVIGLATLVRQR